MKKLYITAFAVVMLGFIGFAVANADAYKDKLNKEVAIEFLEFNGCEDIEGEPEEVENGYIVRCNHDIEAIFDVSSKEYILMYSGDPNVPYTRDVWSD